MPTNAGVNWQSVQLPSGGVRYYDMQFINYFARYICGRNGTIMKTRNAGYNWENQVTNVSSYIWAINFISNDTGYSVGSNGVILKTVTGGEPIRIKKINFHVPEQFELHQNYPNPFNSSTVIRFEIPDYTDFKITIHDVLGRESETILTGKFNPGIYKRVWEAGKFSSGVYICRLSTDEYAYSKIMLLLK
jgi:hypothetical protein